MGGGAPQGVKVLKTTMLFAFVFFILFSSMAFATPEYSGRSAQGCKVCHIEPMGGSLTEAGLEFAASGYVWPPKGGYRVIGPIRKSVRFVIGLFHIVAAFLWFGTILYVHLLLRPAYAEKGLPKGEVRLGVVSMAVVGATGILLTVSRIKSLSVLYESPWGLVLLSKISLYLVMIASAAAVVVFIGPKLKEAQKSIALPTGGVFDPVTLAGFDGRDGREAFIALHGKVYDVTGLRMWKNGQHIKHLAGTDLSEALPKAPHGPEKLEPLRVVGSFDASREPEKTIHQKLFYVVAYMNLGIVFVVLFAIAYWRWGI